MNTKAGFRRWDAANYLESEEDIAEYLAAVTEDGDPALIAAALGQFFGAGVVIFDFYY